MASTDDAGPGDDTGHPKDCSCEDCVSERESVAYGRAHAAEYCDTHAAELRALIETYPDGDAHDLLDNIREAFWARLWKPR